MAASRARTVLRMIEQVVKASPSDTTLSFEAAGGDSIALRPIPSRLPTAAVRFCVRNGGVMPSVSATEARRRLYALIDEVGESHEAVQITGKRGNAVLLSEEDWRSMQETLHLVSIPGMRESILEGMATDVANLSSEPGW